MTEGQRYLFQLMKELDEICKKHNITYYLAGGTLIGAVRHRGFVPWDDDADLYMTQDEFQKLIQVARDGGLPEGRILECQELDRGYKNTFGRYMDLTTSAIHKSQIGTSDYAGEVLDILQLDPIPDGKKAELRQWRNLTLYSELVNDASPYSHRVEANRVRYLLYRGAEKIFGRDRILTHLERKMFRAPKEQCHRYMMRWGGAPLVFPYEMFDEAVSVDYEGIQVYIPARFNDYLTYHYGDEWIYVPHVDHQMSHEAVHSATHSSEDIRRVYQGIVSKDELFAEYRTWKIAMLWHARRLHRVADALMRSQCVIVKEELASEIKRRKLNISALYQAGDYSVLSILFERYYAWQNSANLSGRDTYQKYYRYQNPILIELPDDMLAIALRVQFDLGRASKSWRVLDIYEEKKGKLPPALIELRADITQLRNAQSLHSLGEKAQAIQELNALLKRCPRNLVTIKLLIKSLLETGGTRKRIQSLIKRASALAPEDGEILKYKADLVWEKFPSKAVSQYLEAREKTDNGITLLEIGDRIEEYTVSLQGNMEAAFEQGSRRTADRIYRELSELNPTLRTDLLYMQGCVDSKNPPDYALWETWKRDFHSDPSSEELFPVGMCLLAAMGESPYVAHCHIDVFRAEAGQIDIDQVREEIQTRRRVCAENSLITASIELDKLEADLMRLEGFLEPAYAVYHDVFFRLPDGSVMRTELAKLFRDDLNRLKEMEDAGVSEADLTINFKIKLGSWLRENEDESMLCPVDWEERYVIGSEL